MAPCIKKKVQTQTTEISNMLISGWLIGQIVLPLDWVRVRIVWIFLNVCNLLSFKIIS